jgi:YVTN family beta-propeller protein
MSALPRIHAGLSAVAAVLVLGGVPAQATQGAAPQTPMRYRERPPEEIFRATCATCHGVMAQSGYSWIDPSRRAYWIASWPRPYIERTVREGRIPMMPSFARDEISDHELGELARYIHLLPASYVPEPAYQATVRLLDEDPWFAPVQVAINPGDTVRFVNDGRTFHPVFEPLYISSGGALGERSSPIGPGGVYFKTFDRAGAYPLMCGVHAYMRCEVHVAHAFTPPVYSVHAPAPPPPVPGVGEIWVCAEFQDWPGKPTDGVVQVIDAATWSVTHVIPVGNNPHALWFGEGGREAMVTSWFDVSLARIDALTKTVKDPACLAGAAPAHIVSDYRGEYWFVSMSASNYVQRFDQEGEGTPGKTSSWQWPAYAPLGGNGPHSIGYGAGKVVTSNAMDSTFSVIDSRSMTEIALLPAGLRPAAVAIDTTGRLGATGNTGAKSLSIYDLAQLAWIRDIPFPRGPAQIFFTPDNRYIVANNGEYVSFVDAAKAADAVGYPDPTSAIVAHVWTGKGAHATAFGPRSDGGTYAYVTNKFENYVSVIDVATFTKVGDVPLVTTTTGKVALSGATDTGGNGIAVRPSPPPWR